VLVAKKLAKILTRQQTSAYKRRSMQPSAGSDNKLGMSQIIIEG
jgi:hypothetical protein